jgi:hypothetical protein
MEGVSGVRWQEEDQLHLTLRFIGEVDRHQASDVAAALGSIHHPRFTVGLSGIGSFDKQGKAWSKDDEEAFKSPIRAQYETQGHPYYATARLWDDGVIDPAQTRRVLSLALSASLNAPIGKTSFGVFRM